MLNLHCALTIFLYQCFFFKCRMCACMAIGIDYMGNASQLPCNVIFLSMLRVPFPWLSTTERSNSKYVCYAMHSVFLVWWLGGKQDLLNGYPVTWIIKLGVVSWLGLSHQNYVLSTVSRRAPVLYSAMTSLGSLSVFLPHKVNGGRDNSAQFSVGCKCHSPDLEPPLAPVCIYVTIMIRIDDRTFWFHCLARGLMKKSAEFERPLICQQKVSITFHFPLSFARFRRQDSRALGESLESHTLASLGWEKHTRWKEKFSQLDLARRMASWAWLAFCWKPHFIRSSACPRRIVVMKAFSLLTVSLALSKKVTALLSSCWLAISTSSYHMVK